MTQFLLWDGGILLLGFVLDWILGDPPWLYHPVRAMGALIQRLESPLRKAHPDTPAGRRRAGGQMVVLAIAITLFAYWMIVLLASLLGPAVAFLVRGFLSYQLLATRDLYNHSIRILRRLRAGDLPGSRQALSRIVGRDTQNLDEAGIVRATVESVSENTADGVVAPLFYLALGGPLLGAVYKMTNTMDSMVGYQNNRYQDFGRYAAKLDDVANWIPARLSACTMMVAAALCKRDVREAFRIWKRDRTAHASPNSAQTEAVCAGALGIQLGGSNLYGGEVVSKPTIGDDTRPPNIRDIEAANSLMLCSSFLAFLFCLLLRMAVVLMFAA